MQNCPRCHSSMILDTQDAMEGWRPMWKCLGCGREVLQDDAAQAEDDRLFAHIQETYRLPTRDQGR